MPKPLLDTDGENKAVRAFLMGLELGCYSADAMYKHMHSIGYPLFPEWMNEYRGHLSKAQQQSWLRYLFELENK